MAEVSAAPPLPRPFASTPPVPLPSPPPSRGCHPLRPSAGRPASGGGRAVSAGPPLPSMAAVGGEPPVVAPPLVLARDPPPSQAALLPWMHPADPRAILHVLRSDGEPVSVFEFPRKWVGLACAGAAACRRSLSPILLFVHLLFVAMLVLRAAILCFRIAWLLFFFAGPGSPRHLLGRLFGPCGLRRCTCGSLFVLSGKSARRADCGGFAVLAGMYSVFCGRPAAHPMPGRAAC